MAVEIHFHFPNITDASKIFDLSPVLDQLTNLQQEITIMTAEVQRLITTVAAFKTVSEGVVTTLDTLATIIRSNVDNPVALTKLADDLDAQQANISAAIERDAVVSTPPPPPVPPTA